MDRFFFHVDYSLDTIRDPEGSDCTDLSAAQVEAKAIIRELATDCLTQDRRFKLTIVSICNAEGNVLAKVTAVEALSEILSLASH